MKKGFTLVELSIVLVIIGLLIGGILVGQSLIESAKTLNSTRYLSQITTTMKLFDLRFRQLPGDYSRASQVLGGTSGNGDGVISRHYLGEGAHVLDHLVRAGFIESSKIYRQYDFEDDNYNIIIYQHSSFGTGGNYSGAREPIDTNFIVILPHDATWNWGSRGGLMPKTAHSLDSKIDDGLPGKGLIRAYNPNVGSYASTGCIDGTNSQYSQRGKDWENGIKCILQVSFDAFD